MYVFLLALLLIHQEQPKQLPPVPIPQDDQPRRLEPLPFVEAQSVAPAHCVRVVMAGGMCSGTCVATDGRQSLILSCDHCFSKTAEECDACVTGYPQSVRIVQLSTGKSFVGRAVVGSGHADCGLVVIDGVLPVAPINPSRVPVGTEVRHYGITSGPAVGKVTSNAARPGLSHQMEWTSTLSSIPGDSGAGIFADGALVAWNWGYGPKSVQRGTPIEYAIALFEASGTLKQQFRKFGYDATAPGPIPPKVDPGLPPVVPPVVPPKVDPGTPPPPVAPPHPKKPRFRLHLEIDW